MANELAPDGQVYVCDCLTVFGVHADYCASKRTPADEHLTKAEAALIVSIISDDVQGRGRKYHAQLIEKLRRISR